MKTKRRPVPAEAEPEPDQPVLVEGV